MKGFELRLLSLLLLLTACAHAVEVTARIRGTVTDPTGAVLPNITVTATNQDTGVVTTTTTMANGDYIFQKLPIGTYSVSATGKGFVGFTATGVGLNIDQEYVLPIKLTVGSSVETVEVQANAVQVNTTDMQLSNVVGGRQITELPTIGNSETIVTRASCHFVVHLKKGFEQLQLRSGLVLVATLCCHWRIPDAYYPATDMVKSCRRCNPILPLAESSAPRRHGDSGRSNRQ
jgi:hypothetical protein